MTAVIADFAPAAAYLEQKAVEWGDALLESVALGNEDVERDIQAVQWGGRPGLNIRKGNLFGSLILSARRAFGRLVFGDVENHDATYWWYHDKSGLNGAVFTRDTVFGRPVTPFQTFLPVRTDLFGRFETAGMGFYEARAAAALGRTFG